MGREFSKENNWENYLDLEFVSHTAKIPEEFTSGGMMPISIGDTAPDFSLQDETGLETKLSSFKGNKSVILVFYPADNTSG